MALDPTNAHKRWTWEAKEAFGMQAPVENPQNDGNFVFNARFPGQWFDEETGLFQNGYRDYNPQTGRYMQSDPIGLSAGWNTYGYVGGNPLVGFDFYGLENLNLMHPTRDKYLYDAANKVEDRKGTFKIFAHGNIGVLTDSSNDGDPIYLSPKALLERLIAMGWNGEPIILFSCLTGNSDNGYAYKLSKLAKAPVIAPTWSLWADSKGYVGIYRNSGFGGKMTKALLSVLDYDHMWREQYGEWRTFNEN